MTNTTLSDEQASVCEGDLPHCLAGVVRGEEVRGRPLEGKGHLIPSRKFNAILPTPPFELVLLFRLIFHFESC